MIIYFIFSQEGFEEAKSDILADKATLWVNADFLSDEHTVELQQAGINVHTFPEKVNGSNEKSILQALKPIEEKNPEAEILIEYL
ncbi:MAG: hypothetical protein PSN44_09855 [Gammaproteobacteria bacterium]|nr:hypothetical protein [Gammaproteobacteria bacterium]